MLDNFRLEVPTVAFTVSSGKLFQRCTLRHRNELDYWNDIHTATLLYDSDDDDASVTIREPCTKSATRTCLL